MNISIGRIVHYVLSAYDAEKINRLRTDVASIAERLKETDVYPQPRWPQGAQAHIGNTVEAGMEFPAMCVRDWKPEADAADNPGEGIAVNLQVFLDGSDVFWATSVHEDQNTDKKAPPTPGTYHWPVRE